MKFKKTQINFADAWISGIYKIVGYNSISALTLAGASKICYAAYYKPKGWKNWGNYVAKDTPFYKSMKQAKEACERHLTSGVTQ